MTVGDLISRKEAAHDLSESLKELTGKIGTTGQITATIPGSGITIGEENELSRAINTLVSLMPQAYRVCDLYEEMLNDMLEKAYIEWPPKLLVKEEKK